MLALAQRAALDGARPSAVRPPPQSRLQGACGAETPSLGQESGCLQMEKRTQQWGPCGSPPADGGASHCGAGGRAGSKAQVRLARRPGTLHARPQVTRGDGPGESP